MLDCASDEHAAQAPMRERGKAEPLATIRQRLARFVDRKQPFIVRLAVAEFFNQRAQLRIDRDDETDVGLVPVNDDATGIQIDIAALDRRGLSLSESSQVQETPRSRRSAQRPR